MNVIYRKAFGGSLEYKGIQYPITKAWQHFSEEGLQVFLKECGCGCGGEAHPILFCPIENCWMCGQRGHWNVICPNSGAPNTCHLLRFQAVEDIRNCAVHLAPGSKLAAVVAERSGRITSDADYSNGDLVEELLCLGGKIRRELRNQAIRPFVAKVCMEETAEESRDLARRIRNQRAHVRAKARKNAAARV